MADDSLPLAELLQKAGDGDFLCGVAEAVLQILMEADVEGLIPDPDDQFATAVAGHQSKRVSALMISGIVARVRQRALRTVSRASSVAKCWLATASLVGGHKRSAGCSSGV